MDEEISVLEIFTVLKKNMRRIIVLGLIGLLASFALSFFMQTEEYYATAKISVNNSIARENIEDIIKRPGLLEAIQKEFALDLTEKEIADTIEISRQDDTSLYKVKVTSKKSGKASEIVNYITARLQRDADEILDIPTYTVDEFQAYETIQTIEKLTQDAAITEKEATIAIEAIEARTNLKDTVEVIFEGTSEKRVAQNTTLNLAIGTMTGLMIGVGFVFIQAALDTTVKNEAVITKETGWRNLGTVRQVKQTNDIKKSVPKEKLSDSISGLRANLSLLRKSQELKSLVITSAEANLETVNVAANLAVSFATKEMRVLLVDGNVNEPIVHELFGVSNKVGISNALTDREQPVNELIYSTETVGLDVLTSGPKPSNSENLYASKEVGVLIKELEKLYDLVIFTTTSLVSDAEARLLINKVDGTLFVVSKGRTTKEDLKTSKEVLQLADANVIGAVMNEFDK